MTKSRKSATFHRHRRYSVNEGEEKKVGFQILRHWNLLIIDEVWLYCQDYLKSQNLS